MASRLRVMVSCLLVGAMALTAQAEVWESDRTEALDVGTTPYEITVESGKTVKMSGTITGSAAITKKGLGTLLITSANGDFSGGFVIEKGYLTASNATALGSAAVTIVGQTANNSGDCGLGLWGVGKGDKTVITYANAINITGNTTYTYPALIVYGQNAVLTGKITAAQDFTFYDDLDSTKAISSSYYNRADYVTSLTFGEIEAGGRVQHDGWTRFNFAQKVKASAFVATWSRSTKFNPSNESNRKAKYEFSAALDVKAITNSTRNVLIATDGVFNGPMYVMPYYNSYDANGIVYMQGHDLKLAGMSVAYNSLILTSTETYSIYNATDCGYKTLTIDGGKAIGDTTAKTLSSIAMLRGNLNLTIDAYPGFTQIISNRTHTMSGTIAVKSGALEFGGAATFAKVTGITVETGASLSNLTTAAKSLAQAKTLTVNGVLSSPAEAFDSANTALTALSLGENAALDLHGGELRVTTLTVNGSGKAAGIYDSLTYPQIKSGRLVVLSDASGFTPTPATWNGTSWDPSDVNLLDGSVAATFDSTVGASTFDAPTRLYGITFAADSTGYSVGGSGVLAIGQGGIKIADSSGTAHTYTFANKMEVIGNQDWIIAPKGKLVFDDAITNQTGAIRVRGGKKSNIACDLVFKGTNIIAGAMVVTGATVNVTGLLGTPGHVNQGTAENSGAKTLSILGNNAGKASIYLNNGVIEKPVYLNYSDYSVLKSANNTTNAISGNMQSTSPWFGFAAGKTSEIAFEGGFTSGWTMRSTGTDASSVLRVRKTPINATASVGWNVHLGTLALDVAGNKFIYLTTAQNNGGSGCIDFGASYAFTNSNSMAFEPGFYFDNTYGQAHATSGNPKVYFHSTTQTVYTLAGGKRATIYADEGARLEVFKQTSPSTGQLPNARIYFASQIEGPLTIEMRGDGKLPLILSNQTFHSSGALIASKGVLDLAATATWLNGREFTAKGTGTLKFGANGQTDKMAVMNFADTGKVEIPSGVTVKVREAYVDGEQVPTGEYTKDSTTGGMTGRITGNGTLKVLSCGTTITLW